MIIRNNFLKQMAMIWSKPRDEHIIYEALSAIADGRLELIEENKAKCTSSSKDKFYVVEYDPETNAIMSNDNMAFWVKEISYPMLAMLLAKEVIKYEKKVLEPLKGIEWKALNKKNKNNYMKSVEEVLEKLSKENYDRSFIENEAKQIYKKLLDLELNHMGPRKVPPQIDKTPSSDELSLFK
jgi:hypothetical protein